MTDPVIFDSQTPRFGLPNLFMGQAQKEIFVNEAHALVDALMHCTIEAETADPPAFPVDGDNWLIAAPATGAWAGEEGRIACRQAGNWIFVSPRDGLRVFDRQRGQELFFVAGWNVPAAPVNPTGGVNVDAEARAAIAEVVAVLRATGLIPAA